MKTKVERKRIGAYSSCHMSIPNTTFKYKEIKMELDGVFNDVMVSVNESREIETTKCHVIMCLNFLSIHLNFHQKY